MLPQIIVRFGKPKTNSPLGSRLRLPWASSILSLISRYQSSTSDATHLPSSTQLPPIYTYCTKSKVTGTDIDFLRSHNFLYMHDVVIAYSETTWPLVLVSRSQPGHGRDFSVTTRPWPRFLGHDQAMAEDISDTPRPWPRISRTRPGHGRGYLGHDQAIAEDFSATTRPWLIFLGHKQARDEF